MKKVLFILLAGVAAGMLLAPEKGIKTRKKLVKSLDDIKDRAVNEMNRLVEKGKDFTSKGKKAAQKASKTW
jgi:gas vesicle protein